MRGHIWDTFYYFFSWGLFYGAVLGAFLGTAFFPIVGTLLGALGGGIVGAYSGMISGVIASGLQAYFFHADVDLETYSRRSARLIGAIISVSAVAVWGYMVSIILGPDPRDDAFKWTVLMLSLPPIFLLAGLSAAYTAYRYPSAIIQRMAKRGRLIAPVEVLRPIPNEVKEAFNRLMRNQPPRWLYLGAGVISFSAFLIAFRWQGSVKAHELIVTLLAGPGGALAVVLAWAYCVFGNAMVLTFLKRVVYPTSLSAHWHRVSLTFISFVLTWAMIWWTTILAPILAATMAFTVYRTLALPDEPFEKAKRKEKNALALQDESDDEDDLLMDEDLIIEASREQ
jgi:hypothetical protein